jgi:3-oxoacyl-[acyl-carrier-protein] synthase-1
MAGGLRNFQEGSMILGTGEPARTSRLPDVDEDAPRAERISFLTRWAVADLLENSTISLSGRIPVYVGVADDSPEADLMAIAQGLAEGSQGSIEPESFLGYHEGRIAFLSAMARAIRSFDEGAGELALILAADTRCTWDSLDALFRERRLLTNEDDGTIPGEAAVVALVASARSNLAAEHARFLVGAPAFAEDEFETICQSPQVTQGLGRAFRAIREHPLAGAIRPGTVISFETGELFFTRAFTTGYLRNAELMPEPLQHELIATNLGDTGAAAAGMALVRADWMIRRLEDEGIQRVLIYGHADDGRCAAAMAMRR